MSSVGVQLDLAGHADQKAFNQKHVAKEHQYLLVFQVYKQV